MKDILEAIRNLEDMRFLKPASLEQIEESQRALGVIFADDYREYVHKYGAISERGIELTGVTTAVRLDVVAVTKREREINKYIPKSMYVIENVGIDGIAIIQDSDGKVYSITMSGNLKCICMSLTEYVEQSNF